MKYRRGPEGGALLLGVLLLTLALPTALRAAEDEEPGLPLLDVGTGTLLLDSSRAPIAYSVTAVGPLVAAPPLIARLGGELEVGPLGRAHTLAFDDAVYAFGPDSDALTRGEEILPLSQRPVVGPAALQVPLDLLEEIYGARFGYDFRWEGETRRLRVDRRIARELGLEFNLVHLQGVTTAVFQFSTRPRYRIRRGPRAITIELVGDRLAPGRPAPVPDDPLVRDVSLTPQAIRLRLAADAVAEDYVLEEPFRLVFDVFRGSQPAPAAERPGARPRPPRERPGLRTIVLDPGHGGSDTGAVSGGGIQEKELTLQLARTLKRLLEERLPVRVILTRSEDADLPLERRAALANQNKGDLFISLHLNSAVGTRAHGAETYFLSLEASDEAAAAAARAENLSVGGATDDPLFDLQLLLWDLAQSHHLSESQRLAGLIQKELNAALELHDRGVKQAPFRVLMGISMPAVLVELGFLSNPEEEAKLRDADYRNRLADTLVRAVTRYRALSEGAPEEPAEAVR